MEVCFESTIWAIKIYNYFERLNRKRFLTHASQHDAVECFGRGGAWGGNMAATDQEESPIRPKFTTNDAETSGQTTEWTESGGALQTAHETPSRKSTESPGDMEGESVATDGGLCVSHSGVSVESTAGVDRASCKSPDEHKPSENMMDIPASEQGPLDDCETQDDDGDDEEEEIKTQGQETEESGM